MDDKSTTKHDKEKLYNRIKIGFIFIHSVIDGMIDGTYGPPIKDYQCLYQESLQRISLLYPVLSTSTAIGTLVYFFIRKYLDPYRVATAGTIINCLLLVSLPLLPVFWLALLFTAIIGLATGLASHARLFESGNLAEDNAVPVHLFPLGFTTGSFISTLIISPFLGENHPPSSNCSHGNTSNCDNHTLLWNNKTVNNTIVDECDDFQSNILFGFIVILGIGVVPFVAYIFLRSILRKHPKKEKEEKAKSDGQKSTGKLDIVFLFLLCLIIVVGGSTNVIYGNFLSTFGINSSLKISPRMMSLMTSSFHATTLVAGIVGTCASLVVSQITMVVVCMAGSIAAAISLVFLSELSIISLWTATSVLAFSYSPLFGAVVGWSIEVSKAKHILYGVVIFGDLVGASVIAFLMGQLMNYVDMNFLNYSMLAACVIQVVIFFLLYVISKYLVQSETTTLEVTRM